MFSNWHPSARARPQQARRRNLNGAKNGENCEFCSWRSSRALCNLVGMTAEFIAIVAVGLSLAGLMLRMTRHMDQCIDRLDNRTLAVEHGLGELRGSMARLEALVEASLGISSTRQSAEPG